MSNLDKWRQGSILPKSSLEILTNLQFDLAMAISHSCDIACDIETEPEVEFLGANIIKDDGNTTYKFSKNPRRLHLPINSRGKTLFLELFATKKFKIAKDQLDSHPPDDTFFLEKRYSDILQSWLAARYRRQALPKSLDLRLNPIKELLEKQGKTHAEKIHGFWIQFDPFDRELDSNENYEFSLVIVYSSDHHDSQDIADQLSKKVIQIRAKLKGIDLNPPQLYSDKEFTLFDMTQFIEFRYDYISHRTIANTELEKTQEQILQ
jgi:hypothetical protein